MSRPRRVVVKNGIYHLYNRFVDGVALFALKDEIVELFLKCFYKSAIKFNVKVLILYLMPNHFHSVIKIYSKNLSEFMHYYATNFTQRLNKLLNRKGHVFQSRHNTRLVKDDAYLKTLIGYIFNNASRAGLVQNPLEYKCCNLNDILSSKDDEFEEILNIFSDVRETAKKEFCCWIKNLDIQKNYEEYTKKINGQFLMPEADKNEILKEVERRKSFNKKEIKLKQRKTDKINIEKEIKLMTDFVESNSRLIEEGAWKSIKKAQLHIKWYLLNDVFNIRLKQIADVFRINRVQTISKAISEIEKSILKNKIAKKFKSNFFKFYNSKVAKVEPWPQ